MSKQSRRAARPRQTSRTWLIVAVVGVIVLIGGVIALPTLTNSTRTSLPDSANTFSVPTLVGQSAPAFTATNVDGKPFTLTPGDGKAKVIVFYMGFR